MNDDSPRLASPAVAARVSSGPRKTPGVALFRSSGEDPDVLADEILLLLSEERFQEARRIALQAAARFPKHPRLRTARRIFNNRKKATRRPGNEPSRKEEFAWLSHPPESARGKWVALLGSELIGAAESLEDLMSLVRAKELPNPALVHFID